METLNNLLSGFGVALTWLNLTLALAGSVLGTIIGALPGLGPANGIAILIPIVFAMGLDATQALILLVSVYYGCMYGGSISSILLNIPGDEPAVMTTLDGYPMARKGLVPEALALSGVSSFVGAFFALWGLSFLAPLLVQVALLFGPAEYFAMFTLAFATLGGVGSANAAKAGLATGIGLAIALIGVDGQTGVPRFTFGLMHLNDGIDFLIAIVGFFALSEVLIFIEAHGTAHAHQHQPVTYGGGAHMPLSMLKLTAPTMARGSVLGFIAGILPGAGASFGSFIAYVAEKKWLGARGYFGQGDPRGVAAPEAGNNAAAGGTLVPMLALGVPGSATTAVLLGVLVSLDITPGPLLFTKNPDVVWGLIASLFIGNIMLLILNLPMVGLFARVLNIPVKYLMPGVVLISFVGVYGISGSIFDLYLMLAFGVLGWLFRKADIPMVPVVMALVLGEQMEKNLRRALTISDGNLNILWDSPLAMGLLILAVLAFVVPLVWHRVSNRRSLMEQLAQDEPTR